MGKIVGLTFPNPEAEKPVEDKPILEGETIAPVEEELLEVPAEEEKKPAHSGKKKQETKDGE